MNYAMYYDFDNYDDVYECIPAVKHGVTFKVFDCVVRIYKLNDPQIIFWVDGNVYSKEEARGIFDKVSKLLSYLFALPFCSKENRCVEVSWVINANNSLSKKTSNTLCLLEKKINKFKKAYDFYSENLDLINIALENLFKSRDEDAFLYFFKVIERIAKQYYIVYMQRHHTKATTRKNKQDLRVLLEAYALNNLKVKLTEDMLDRKVDLFYKSIKMEFYGSVFNKISLFVTNEQININGDIISRIVKVRNKIAHGDTVDNSTLECCLGECEYLAMQMFSFYFFRRPYDELHITSYRYFDKIDPYK